jgi:hypothetical protein
MGEGDHTWTETYAVEREVYDKIQEAEKNFRKTTSPKSKPKTKLTEEEEEELSVLDELEEEMGLPFENEIDGYVDDEDDYLNDEFLEEE